MKKRFTRILSFFIAVVTVLSLVPAVAAAAEPAPDLIISNATELMNFNASLAKDDYAGKIVQLSANIDLNPGISVDEMKRSGADNAWIGTRIFKGTFDGNGHTISGLYCKSTTSGTGFFGQASGTIKNLTIKRSYIYATVDGVGGLVGTTISGTADTPSVLTIENCVVDTDIIALGDAAGIVGTMVNITNSTLNITNTAFAGSVTSTDSNDKAYIGGLLSRFNQSNAKINISGCAVTGIIDIGDSSIAGGFVGHCNKGTLKIQSSVFDGELRASGSYQDARLGGAIASIQGGTATVNNCAIFGSAVIASPVSGTNYSVGNLVTYMQDSFTYEVTNTLAAMDQNKNGKVLGAATLKGTATDGSISLDNTVYYVSDMVDCATISNVSTSAVAKTKSQVFGAPLFASNWTARAGKLPIPTSAEASYHKALAVENTPAAISVRTIGVQHRVGTPDANGNPTNDYRIVSVVSGYIGSEYEGKVGIGHQYTISYIGLDGGSVTETYYSTKGYYNIQSGGVTLNAKKDYNGDFFVTLLMQDVPVSLKNISISITPFVASDSTTKIAEGKEAKFTWQRGTYNVLFIGNSHTYSNNMPLEVFSGIANSVLGSGNVLVTSATQGSGSLTNHYAGTTKIREGVVIKDEINSGKYDCIVLQEKLVTPITSYNTYKTAVTNFVNSARAVNPHVKIVLYAVWGSQYRDWANTTADGTAKLEQAGYTFSTTPEKGVIDETVDMTYKLAAAAVKVAKELDLTVVHAGLAYLSAFNKDDEFKKVQSKTEKESYSLYNFDGYHPSFTGSYLAALTLFAAICEADPRLVTWQEGSGQSISIYNTYSKENADDGDGNSLGATCVIPVSYAKLMKDAAYEATYETAIPASYFA